MDSRGMKGKRKNETPWSAPTRPRIDLLSCAAFLSALLLLAVFWVCVVYLLTRSLS